MGRVHVRLVSVAAVLAAAGACTPWQTLSDTDVLPDTSVLYATPSELTWHTGIDAGGETKSFAVVNATDHDVDVWNYTQVDGDDALFAVTGAGLGATLQPGDQIEIPVTFSPVEQGERTGSIDVLNSDGVPLTIDLDGHGLAAFLAESVDGEPEAIVGCPATTTLHLGNPGSEALTIGDVDPSTMGDFSLDGALPASLDPGDAADVAVTFTPTSAGERFGVLRFSSNDPQRPSVAVGFHGKGVVGTRTTDTFHYETGDGLSVLLAVDTSGAWASKFDDGLGDLLDALDARGVDWRVAAVDADDGCPGSLSWATPADDRNQSLADLRATLDDGGADEDRLLELVHLAVDNTASGGCLDGFLDRGRPLAVLLASGRDDASPGGWSAEVAAVQDQVSSVRYSAWVPLACGTAPSYQNAVTSTSGVAEDLCASVWQASDWDAIAAAMADQEGGPTTFTLTEPAISGSVYVHVNGDDWPYTIDNDHQRVTLSQAPEIGAEVVVGYVPVSACGG